MGDERTEAWIAGYERAWRTAGTDGLAALFAEDAVYLPDPYAEPVRGLAAIARFWEAEREGPDEAFTMTSSVVAVQGDRSVVRLEVHYGAPSGDEYRDLWVITFDATGRARVFEEWPFFPGRTRVAPQRAP